MYAHWRPGHFDLLGLMENGRVKIAFTPTESTVAENAIDSLLEPTESKSDLS